MLEIKEFRTAENVVVIEMRVADHIVVAATVEIGLEAAWQRYSLVRRVVVAFHVGVVEQDLLPALQVNSATIGIPKREKGQLVHGFPSLSPSRETHKISSAIRIARVENCSESVEIPTAHLTKDILNCIYASSSDTHFILKL